ncbi:F-box only protein 43 [Periophthalmus magnuspinnatus]|uniref:F-box only protein 43 n=1 Tax=Periophthalmus magnuspinnatus TaxID=409849 RepID=UPI0024365376|nr:F-box only protein 43 [Periophthalmus magnuspinnatus]
MQCTPEPNVFFNSDKERACYDDCFDSGYSGLFYTPQSITRDGSLSLGESDETPKENLRLSAAPKDRTRFWNKDRAACWPSTGLCETPRLYKRDASLQHRLALCKSILDVKANPTKSPNKSLSNCVSGQWLSTSLDSLDTVIGTLSTSTLALDQDVPLSGRKRRHLYSQVRTSTLEDGQATFEQLSSFDRRVSLSDADFKESCSPSSPQTPRTNKLFTVMFKKSLHSPACNDLSDSSVLYTPSSLDTPNYTRSVCEDSGFSSLTLDKSQDSSVDHDGSFQELLLSASKGNGITPNLLDTKRRPRLQRQNRLSTLKEGGSQSEDDPTERSKQGQQPLKEDEVFTGSTPFRALSIKPRGSVSFESVVSTKQDYGTPLRRTSAKGEGKTPFSSDSPPSRNTPLNLSMTPALQLVHAMCQQKAQALNGQSPSLKDELRSTAALVHTPVTFRTTMPLAGLIGRKIGVGTVDILTELNKRNLKHILSLILGLLTPKCIYRCGKVCKSWKGIIKQDRRASFKRRSHLSELNSSLEGAVSHVPEADTRTALLKRSALKTVQSQSRSQSFCTPQSSSRSATPLHNSTFTSASSSKRDKFIEVAKTLFNDECLKPCPRCQHPARCHSVKGEGVCSSADCGFQFCTSCLCAFHGSKECGSHSVNRRKKDVLIPGSAQSKRNIRRL